LVDKSRRAASPAKQFAAVRSESVATLRMVLINLLFMVAADFGSDPDNGADFELLRLAAIPPR
jgi:hypothetical protein